jgi:hypothetical protein
MVSDGFFTLRPNIDSPLLVNFYGVSGVKQKLTRSNFGEPTLANCSAMSAVSFATN